MAQKIILDIDNALTIPVQDTDDALALALALVSPELELVGVTTCAGNCRTDESTRNTLRLLQTAGAVNVPVAEGRSAPLVRDREAHFRYLAHKSAGPQARFWHHLPEPPQTELTALEIPAHAFTAQALTRFPNELVYIALGSLTNLALALEASPGLARKIKRVIHMGGSFEPISGPAFVWSTPDIPDDVWRTTLRFNTAFDPEASAAVFRSGAPLTFITANVTSRVYQRPSHLERLRATDTPFHRFLHTYARPWVEWSIAERKLPGAHMHDPLTVAAVIDPAFCRLETLYLDTAALLEGRTPWLVREPAGPPVQAAIDVDQARFEAFLAERLTREVLSIYRTQP